MAVFEYRTVWKSLAAAESDAVLDFWSRHGAITDPAVARARLEELVLVADSAGELAGVCTARRIVPTDIGQPLYYYRSFVAPRWRGSLLVQRLLLQACDVLEDYSAGHPDEAALGVYLELENPIFSAHLRTPVWTRRGRSFVYIGRNARGLERRLLWFRHARI